MIVGQRVVMVETSEGNHIVAGDVGTVVKEHGRLVWVRLDRGGIVTVFPWRFRPLGEDFVALLQGMLGGDT